MKTSLESKPMKAEQLTLESVEVEMHILSKKILRIYLIVYFNSITKIETQQHEIDVG